MSNARAPLSEVYERLGRFDEAIAIAHTELNAVMNMNLLSKMRVSRSLGRCHAALGQHAISVAALDAALQLAGDNKFLLSEALTVNARVQVARQAAAAGAAGEVHWKAYVCKQRLVEVMGRMQGPTELHEALLAAVSR